MMPISHVDQLLELDGPVFVSATYSAVLGRAPDLQGKYFYLARLQADLTKEQLLVQLGTSAEAKARNAQLPGLTELIAAHAAIDSRQRKGRSWLSGLFSPRINLDWHLSRLAHEIAKISRQLARQHQAPSITPASAQTIHQAVQATPPPPSSPQRPKPDLSGLGSHARKLTLAVMRDQELLEKRAR